MKLFHKTFPDKDAFISLPLWHRFEIMNPDIFGGMYQLLVQKK